MNIEISDDIKGKYTEKVLIDNLDTMTKHDVSDLSKYFHPKTKEEAITYKWNYKYFNTLPIIKIDDTPIMNNIINPNINIDKDVEMIKPYEWKHVNMKYDNIDGITLFMNKNYNDKNNSKFGMIFTNNYLSWVCDYGLLAMSNGKIGAVLLYNITNTQLYKKSHNMSNVKHICIHKKLREKQIFSRIVDKHIYEMQTMYNIKLGSFVTPVYIPTPVSKLSYYYRPINYDGLCKTEFIVVDESKNAKKIDSEIYEVFGTKQANVKQITDKNQMNKLLELYDEYKDKYNIYDNYDLDTFTKVFNNEYLKVYGIYEDDNIVDFYTMYEYDMINLIDNEKTIKTSMMYIYTSNITTPLMIFKNAIISAKKNGMDMIMCNDTCENIDVLYDNLSRFTKGKNGSYVNFYNWANTEMLPNQLFKF